MRFVPLLFLAFAHIKGFNSLPIEDTPGFTPWPIEKREIAEDIFSNAKFGALFGVKDETCRNKLPDKDGKCWSMNEATVDTFLANRAEKTKECTVPCLFYTERLSGAAERESNFVLRATLGTAATEGPRKYQTIWDLHDKKFYPNADDWSETPETKCIYDDHDKNDAIRKHNGCRRLYFMAMSKAMAMECTGEVFLMTNVNLQGGENVPENGIWWEVEFPTLIDGNRPQDKKVTKITYIQVPKLETKDYEALTPEQKSKPPQVVDMKEYWPTGRGTDQLNDKDKTPEQARSDVRRTLARSNLIQDIDWIASGASPDTDLEKIEKRAGDDDNQILELGDTDYPFHYSIDDMVEWYGDIHW